MIGFSGLTIMILAQSRMNVLSFIQALQQSQEAGRYQHTQQIAVYLFSQHYQCISCHQIDCNDLKLIVVIFSIRPPVITWQYDRGGLGGGKGGAESGCFISLIIFQFNWSFAEICFYCSNLGWGSMCISKQNFFFCIYQILSFSIEQHKLNFPFSILQ